MSRKAARGGVLLDLFIIACLLAGAAAAWMYWKRGGLKALRLPAALAPTAALSPRAEAPAEPDLDISDRSAWLQARVRDLLARHGVGEKHVLKTYNAQRLEGGIQWLEDTLELRRPPRFDEGRFLAALGAALAERRLVLIKDSREGGRWSLDLGDRKRVYQRIVFITAR